MTSSWPSYENFSPENPAKSLYLMLLSVYITCLMTHCHDPLTSAPHFHLPVGSSLLSHTFPCVPFCWANITASTIKTITSETNTSRIRNAFARLMKYPGVSLRLYTGWYSISLVSMLQGWTSDLTESTKNPSPAKLELRVFSYQWPRDKWWRVNKWSERCRLTVIYFLLMRLSIVLIRFFFSIFCSKGSSAVVQWKVTQKCVGAGEREGNSSSSGSSTVLWLIDLETSLFRQVVSVVSLRKARAGSKEKGEGKGRYFFTALLPGSFPRAILSWKMFSWL